MKEYIKIKYEILYIGVLKPDSYVILNIFKKGLRIKLFTNPNIANGIIIDEIIFNTPKSNRNFNSIKINK